MRLPPAVPTWLAQRLVSNHALLGDLVEQFESGRSTLWYWRQVLLAIVAVFSQDIRAHKLLATRAVLTALATWYCFWWLYDLSVVLTLSPPDLDSFQYSRLSTIRHPGRLGRGVCRYTPVPVRRLGRSS
jgi:hypothetical protein